MDNTNIAHKQRRLSPPPNFSAAEFHLELTVPEVNPAEFLHHEDDFSDLFHSDVPAAADLVDECGLKLTNYLDGKFCHRLQSNLRNNERTIGDKAFSSDTVPVCHQKNYDPSPLNFSTKRPQPQRMRVNLNDNTTSLVEYKAPDYAELFSEHLDTVRDEKRFTRNREEKESLRGKRQRVQLSKLQLAAITESCSDLNSPVDKRPRDDIANDLIKRSNLPKNTVQRRRTKKRGILRRLRPTWHRIRQACSPLTGGAKTSQEPVRISGEYHQNPIYELEEVTGRGIKDAVKKVRKSERLEMLYLGDEHIMDYLKILLYRNNSKDIAVAYPSVLSTRQLVLTEAAIQSLYNYNDEKTRYVIFPVCRGRHWTMVHYDKRKNELAYYDSMGTALPSNTIVNEISTCIEKIFNLENPPSATKVYPSTKSEAYVQKDSYNCGCYLLRFAEHRIMNPRSPMPREPFDVAKYRRSVKLTLINYTDMQNQRIPENSKDPTEISSSLTSSGSTESGIIHKDKDTSLESDVLGDIQSLTSEDQPAILHDDSENTTSGDGAPDVDAGFYKDRDGDEDMGDPDEIHDSVFATSSEEEEEVKKGRGKTRTYPILRKECSNWKEMQDFITEENTWSREKKRVIKATQSAIHEFKCKFRRRLRGECSARLIAYEIPNLKAKTRKDLVKKVVAKQDGEHEGHNPSGKQLSSVFTNAIEDLVENKYMWKPKQIYDTLVRNPALKEVDFTMKQVQNYVQRAHRRPTVDDDRTESEIKTMIEEVITNYSHPEGIDEVDKPICLLQEFLGDELDVETMILGFSTPRLLDQMKSQPVYYLDGTYRVLHSGYCLIPVGFCDKARSFRPVAFFIAPSESTLAFTKAFKAIKKQCKTSPKVILSDACRGLQKAINSVYGKSTDRGTCYFHAIKKIRESKKYLPRDKELRKMLSSMIDTDLIMLQKAESEKEFLKVSGMLQNKWRDLKVGQDFLDHVKKWLTDESKEKTHRWYEGVTEHGSTNNALESYHGKFKDSISERERLSFRFMTELLRDELTTRSAEIGKVGLPEKPSVELPEERKAYEKFMILKASGEELKHKVAFFKQEELCLVASETADEKLELKSTYERLKKGNFDSLEEYNRLKSSFYVLRLRDGYYSCSCPVGQKHSYQCKHSVLIAKLSTKCNHTFSEKSKDRRIRLDAKRPGRPRKAHKGGALTQE